MANTLITLIVGLILIGVLVYGEGLLPFDAALVRLIQAATVVIGALILAKRLGAL